MLDVSGKSRAPLSTAFVPNNDDYDQRSGVRGYLFVLDRKISTLYENSSKYREQHGLNKTTVDFSGIKNLLFAML